MAEHPSMPSVARAFGRQGGGSKQQQQSSATAPAPARGSSADSSTRRVKPPVAYEEDYVEAPKQRIFTTAQLQQQARERQAGRFLEQPQRPAQKAASPVFDIVHLPQVHANGAAAQHDDEYYNDDDQVPREDEQYSDGHSDYADEPAAYANGSSGGNAAPDGGMAFDDYGDNAYGGVAYDEEDAAYMAEQRRVVSEAAGLDASEQERWNEEEDDEEDNLSGAVHSSAAQHSTELEDIIEEPETPGSRYSRRGSALPQGSFDFPAHQQWRNTNGRNNQRQAPPSLPELPKTGTAIDMMAKLHGWGIEPEAAAPASSFDRKPTAWEMRGEPQDDGASERDELDDVSPPMGSAGLPQRAAHDHTDESGWEDDDAEWDEEADVPESEAGWETDGASDAGARAVPVAAAPVKRKSVQAPVAPPKKQGPPAGATRSAAKPAAKSIPAPIKVPAQGSLASPASRSPAALSSASPRLPPGSPTADKLAAAMAKAASVKAQKAASLAPAAVEAPKRPSDSTSDLAPSPLPRDLSPTPDHDGYASMPGSFGFGGMPKRAPKVTPAAAPQPTAAPAPAKVSPPVAKAAPVAIEPKKTSAGEIAQRAKAAAAPVRSPVSSDDASSRQASAQRAAATLSPGPARSTAAPPRAAMMAPPSPVDTSDSIYQAYSRSPSFQDAEEPRTPAAALKAAAMAGWAVEEPSADTSPPLQPEPARSMDRQRELSNTSSHSPALSNAATAVQASGDSLLSRAHEQPRSPMSRASANSRPSTAKSTASQTTSTADRAREVVRTAAAAAAANARPKTAGEAKSTSRPTTAEKRPATADKRPTTAERERSTTLASDYARPDLKTSNSERSLGNAGAAAAAYDRSADTASSRSRGMSNTSSRFNAKSAMTSQTSEGGLRQAAPVEERRTAQTAAQMMSKARSAQRPAAAHAREESGEIVFEAPSQDYSPRHSPLREEPLTTRSPLATQSIRSVRSPDHSARSSPYSMNGAKSPEPQRARHVVKPRSAGSNSGRAPSAFGAASGATDYGSSKEPKEKTSLVKRLSIGGGSKNAPTRPPRSPSRDVLSPPPASVKSRDAPQKSHQPQQAPSSYSYVARPVETRAPARELTYDNGGEMAPEPELRMARSRYASENSSVDGHGQQAWRQASSSSQQQYSKAHQSPQSTEHSSGRASSSWDSRRAYDERAAERAKNSYTPATSRGGSVEDLADQWAVPEQEEPRTRSRSGSLMSFKKPFAGFALSLGRKNKQDRDRAPSAAATHSGVPVDRQSIADTTRGGESRRTFNANPAVPDSEAGSIRMGRRPKGTARRGSVSAILASANEAQANVRVTAPTPVQSTPPGGVRPLGRHSRSGSAATSASRARPSYADSRSGHGHESYARSNGHGDARSVGHADTRSNGHSDARSINVAESRSNAGHADANLLQSEQRGMRSRSKSAPSIAHQAAEQQREAERSLSKKRSEGAGIGLSSPSGVLSRLPALGPIAADEAEFEALPPVEKYVALAGVLAEMLWPGGKARVQRLANEGVRLQREQRARELEVERLEEKLSQLIPADLDRKAIHDLHVSFSTRVTKDYAKRDAGAHTHDKERIAALEERICVMEDDIARQRARLRVLAKERPRLATRLEEERKRFEKMRRVENTLRRLRPEVFLTLGAEAKSNFYRSEDGLQLNLVGAEGVTAGSEYHGGGGSGYMSDLGHGTSVGHGTSAASHGGNSGSRTPQTGPSPLEVYGDEGDYAVGLRSAVSHQREIMTMLRAHEKCCYSQLLLAEAALRNCIADVLDIAALLENPRLDEAGEDERKQTRRLSFSAGSRAAEQRRALTDANSAMAPGDDIEDDFERICYLRRKIETRANEIEQLVRAVSNYYADVCNVDRDMDLPRQRQAPPPPSAWNDKNKVYVSKSRNASSDSRGGWGMSDAEDAKSLKNQKSSGALSSRSTGATSDRKVVAFQSSPAADASDNGTSSRFSTAPNSPDSSTLALAGPNILAPSEVAKAALALLLRILPTLRLLSAPATTADQLRRSAFRVGQWHQRAKSTIPQLEDAREALDEVIVHAEETSEKLAEDCVKRMKDTDERRRSFWTASAQAAVALIIDRS